MMFCFSLTMLANATGHSTNTRLRSDKGGVASFIHKTNPVKAKPGVNTALLSSKDIVGYYWILFNDGCYYLYKADYNSSENVTYLYPMNFYNYIGTYVKCMSNEEFSNFC